MCVSVRAFIVVSMTVIRASNSVQKKRKKLNEKRKVCIEMCARVCVCVWKWAHKYQCIS